MLSCYYEWCFSILQKLESDSRKVSLFPLQDLRLPSQFHKFLYTFLQGPTPSPCQTSTIHIKICILLKGIPSNKRHFTLTVSMTNIMLWCFLLLLLLLFSVILFQNFISEYYFLTYRSFISRSYFVVKTSTVENSN